MSIIFIFLWWMAGLIAALGSLNWGLVQFTQFNLVSWVAKKLKQPALERTLYLTVGIAGGIHLLVPFAGVGVISAIGAINWGLVAWKSFDLVEYASKQTKIHNIDKVLYGIVGICGVVHLMILFSFGMVALGLSTLILK